MGMTMAEKCLAKSAGLQRVHAGQYVTARPQRLMAHEALVACVVALASLGISEIPDPQRLVVVLDHFFPAPTETTARAHSIIRNAVRELGIRHFLGHAGVCHQVMCEGGFVVPGQLVLATDSHSTTYGALGAAGAGIGTTEMTYVLATGELWMQVPPTIKVVLDGRPGPALMSKDVVLHIAAQFGTEMAQYKALEFAGTVAGQMGMASRMTISNMGVELGAKFAFFRVDDKALAYLGDKAQEPLEPFGPDPDASYEAVHTVDITGLGPQVALPHNPGNAHPVEEVEHLGIDQAYLGSCTNGRLEDLAVAARVLKGRQVHPNTRLLVSPASRQVLLEAERMGYIRALLEAGAHLAPPGCGACCGSHLGLLAPGEVCISSTNRNFKGRMGSPESLLYLASPATVAASAVKGAIADPREFFEEPLL